MQQRTINQSKAFHILLKELGLTKEEKERHIFNITEGKQTSSTELTMQEMSTLISTLKALKETRRIKMMTKINAIGRRIEYIYNNDYTKMNEWLLKQFKQAPLYKVDYSKLRDVLRAIEAIESWKNKK